jgi:hypothetical protein
MALELNFIFSTGHLAKQANKKKEQYARMGTCESHKTGTTRVPRTRYTKASKTTKKRVSILYRFCKT